MKTELLNSELVSPWKFLSVINSVFNNIRHNFQALRKEKLKWLVKSCHLIILTLNS